MGFCLRMFKVFTLSAGLVLLCQAPSVEARETLRIAGSGAGVGVLRQLADIYQKRYPDCSIQVITKIGSSGAIKALQQGAVDLVVSSRELTAAEQRSGIKSMEYARTPFIFITFRDVKKSGLTSRELEEIYNGQLLNWPDLTRIRLVLHLEGGTEAQLLKSISPQMAAAVKTAQGRQGMLHASNSDESDEIVARTPGGVGVSTLAQIMANRRQVNILNYNGVQPTLDNLANGSYPLEKHLYLVTPPNPAASTRRFIDFIRSSAGRTVLEKNGNLIVMKGAAR